MHITSVLSYTSQLEELLNLVFLLILRSQTYPGIPKHQLINLCILYADPPPAFYECLMTDVITILRTTAAQKNFLYYLLTTYLLLETLIQKLVKVIWYYLDLLE